MKIQATLLLLLCACAGTEPAPPVAPAPPVEPEAPAPVRDAAAAAESSVRPGLNDRFLAEDLQVEDFVAIFEGESREISKYSAEILAALEIEPGMEVADIGAGTGLFLQSFSKAVGPEGKLYAVDISPRFIDLLRERAQKFGLDNVDVVHCTDKSAELEPNSVDLIFVCDTYHHFEYPLTTLASLHSALRPGGSLVIVDFDRIPGTSSEWIMNHVRAGREVFMAEITSAGFVFEKEHDLPLEENYFLRFRAE